MYLTLEKQFSEKAKVVEINKKALDIGIRHGKENISQKIQLFDPKHGEVVDFLVISGNEASAMAAVAGGLKFLAQYPITPASSILTYMADHSEEYGVIVRQAEDELAALTMVLGASYAGVRAMTATSGPGFSLMAESLGYAASTETPCVIVLSMLCGT